jgi:hypothetical protein
LAKYNYEYKSNKHIISEKYMHENLIYFNLKNMKAYMRTDFCTLYTFPEINNIIKQFDKLVYNNNLLYNIKNNQNKIKYYRPKKIKQKSKPLEWYIEYMAGKITIQKFMTLCQNYVKNLIKVQIKE